MPLFSHHYSEPTKDESQKLCDHLKHYRPGTYDGEANKAIFEFLSKHVVVVPKKDQTILYIDGAWTNAADQVMHNDKVSISTFYGGYGKHVFDEHKYPMKEINAQDKANHNINLKVAFFQATSAYFVKQSKGKLWLAYQGDWKTARSTDGRRGSIFVTDELPSAKLNPAVEAVLQVSPEFATIWNTSTVPAVKYIVNDHDLEAAYKTNLEGGTLPAVQIYPPRHP